MTKRKRVAGRASSSGAKTQDNSAEGIEGREKKRRKRSTSPNTDPADICAELYEIIRNYRNDDGRILCESFIRAPKRRNSPEYYEVISTPIDLLKIQQRLKTDEYEDIDTFSTDVHLLLDNAIKFYKPDVQEHSDAVKLKEVFENAKTRLCSQMDKGEAEMSFEEEMEEDDNGSEEGDDDEEEQEESEGEERPDKGKGNADDDDDNESTSTRDDDEGDSSANVRSYCEELISAVLEMKDSHGRVICQLFKQLPPQSLYPEYYEIIKEPIDLKTICTKLRNTQYLSLEDAEKDLTLMVKNAHAFNEPGSQVYKDATAIKKTIQTKKGEIDHTLMGAKSSKRLKARRSMGKMCMSVTALLNETEELSEEVSELPEEDEQYPEDSLHGDEDASGGDQDSDNPLMMLLSEIYRFTDPTGRALSEPFLRLPSRRAYPDYYEVIKQPIALSKIRSQIKAGQYDSLDELEQDMDLCFQNAQTYNEPNSMLYKDAQRMQEHMKKKKVEILKYMEEKGITLQEYKKKKKPKKTEPELPSTKEEVSVEIIQRKPKTEMRKPKKSKKVEEVDPIVLRKRMRQLYKAVVNYQDENGRYLSAIFVELPSAQDYPDYYQVISEPVCLSQIENNIRDNKYSGEDELMLDFEVMFDNARYYNEEDSQVYQDACTLEKVLRKKRKSLGPSQPVPPQTAESGSSQVTPVKQATPTKSGRISSSPSSIKKYSQVPSATSELKELCRELFNAVKDCTDSHGRQLCLIFQKLPSRAEYPDYYTLIKKPIDMAKINSKLYGDQYQTLDDFMSDFQLMFDNACRYNEPDSQVYKDALSLARELLRKKVELVGDESKVPNVQDVVRKLLSALHQSIISHVDDEGRCFSDSLAEFSVLQPDNKHLSLSSIGEALRKGQYHRLDRYQEDVFAVLEKAREVSRSDAEMYDDAVELQQYFVSQRDKLCKDGERFVSPALVIIKRHLLQELDEERKTKAEVESKEDQKQDELEKREGKQQSQVPVSDEECEQELSYKDFQIHVGDFVFIEPREEKLQPHIVSVEKLYKDNNGEQWLFGSWFYRPEETFHTATRKFLEKEVFKSDYCCSSNLKQVLGKCHVMFVKDYFKQKPEDFKDEDVFVCESRYNVKTKSFKKIKVWSVPPSTVSHVIREEPLQSRRVPSVFVTNTDKAAAQPMDISQVEGPVHEEVKKSVVLESPQNAEEGCVYYEQFCVRDVPYKLGDCVYVRSDEGYLCMSRIDKIWTDRSEHTWFHGPLFISPACTQHLPTRMFYEKEVFLSSLEETMPTEHIAGKCCVLPFREYVRCRPTEIYEKDIYLNEARYDEEEGQFRKLKGLKRYTLTVSVQEDEYYFFEKPISPAKVPSPFLIEDLELLEEECSHSVVSADSTGDGGKKPKKQRGQSGYLLFSHEMRATIRKDHPEYAFGEISRIIGVEWRNMSAQKKADYEARAQMQLSQSESESAPDSNSQVIPTGPLLVYECLWRGCDYQYEDLQDLRIHVLDSTCHLRKSEDGLFHCLWTTCMRGRRGMRPFNASSKLFRHCREVHLAGQPKQITQQQRSKNYFPKHQAALIVASPAAESVQEQRSAGTPVQPPVISSGTPASHMLAGANQFVQTANQMQSNAAYMGGRLTPQAMQQALYQGNTGGMAQSTPAPVAGMMHMNMSMNGMAQQQAQPTGQIGGFPSQQQQQVKQQYSPAQQQQQFNFQQQINQVNNMQQQHYPQQIQQVPPQQQAMPPAPVTPLPPPKETPSPIFHAPPPKPQRLHHSDAYLRYIEGLRDGSPHMSNWNQARRPDASTMTPQQLAQLPVHWLQGCGYADYENVVDALWNLRDHMLRDALSLSRMLDD